MYWHLQGDQFGQIFATWAMVSCTLGNFSQKFTSDGIFTTEKFELTLTKYGWGFNSGESFTETSGHHGQ
jgi:hypothetical protein